MNIICIQVGYMAGAGISWLARINDYMEPTDVGGPATPRTPRLALYLLRPPTPLTLALSLNALLMATAYNLRRPPFRASSQYPRVSNPPNVSVIYPIALSDSFPSQDRQILGSVLYTLSYLVSLYLELRVTTRIDVYIDGRSTWAIGD